LSHFNLFGYPTIAARPTIPRIHAAAGIHLLRPQDQMSFRIGIVWLFIITLGIYAMSDILVDTIDGFALRLHISEVFTSTPFITLHSSNWATILMNDIASNWIIHQIHYDQCLNRL
jgi:hypothetical protein